MWKGDDERGREATGHFLLMKTENRALGTGVLFFPSLSLSLSLTLFWLQPKASQPDEICKYMNFRFNIFQLRKQLIVFSILSLKNQKKNQNNINKWKRYMGKVQRKPRTRFLSSYIDKLNSFNNKV